jgi:D-alanine-D-alanine ligase
MNIAIAFNAPTLAPNHPDFEQEAGVLDSVAAFEAALIAAGHAVRRIALAGDVAAAVNDLAANRPDVVVNLCEGFGGRTAAEPHWAGVLELLAIPYTGSPPECLALVRDKARMKTLLRGAELPTAPFVRLNPGEPLPREPLTAWLAKGPLFVKPAAEDASLGIGPESVVTDWTALERQVASVRDRYGPAMIEPYIDGREFNVTVIALPEPQVLPLAEIDFQASKAIGWPIVTYESKWAPGSAADLATPVRCPADIEPELARTIEQTALDAFQLAGCRDYARIDLRLDRKNKPFILEINANPDAGPTAGLARAVRAAGIAYNFFLERVVQTAASRNH